MTTRPPANEASLQQPHPGQPTNDNVHAQHPAHAQQKNDMALAGFVLALLAPLCFFVPYLNYLSIVCWPLGLIFSCICLSRVDNQGLPYRRLAIAGLVISLAGIVLAIIGLLLIGLVSAAGT